MRKKIVDKKDFKNSTRLHYEPRFLWGITMKYTIILCIFSLSIAIKDLFAGKKNDERFERDQELYARIVQADRKLLNDLLKREREQKEERQRAEKPDVETK